MIRYVKYLLYIFFILIFLFFIAAVYTIVEEEKNVAVHLTEKSLVHEAKVLFDSMQDVRTWNANHGGVYVKQSADLMPNQYLKDNVLYTDKNETLIKINPAWMTRQISEIANKEGKHYFKITSLDVINPNNTADEFEQEALNYFNNNKDEKYYYKINEEKTDLYFMGSLRIEKDCLACHDNYKIGDIRGGIRISVPYKNYTDATNEILKKSDQIMWITILIAIVVLLILLWTIHKIYEWHHEEKTLSEKNILLNQKVKQEIKKNRDKDRLLYTQAKSAQMGDMISMIAHQWRQPLNAISASAIKLDLKQEFGELTDEDIKEVSKFIQNETQEMSQIINDFMNFFKSENDKTTFALTSVFNDVNKIISSQFNIRNIVLHNLIEDGVDIYGHRKELVHIILNIVGNSRDAFENLNQELKEISIEAYKVDENIEISICDNAGGMDEDVVERVFDPYFTTKEQGKGTGIGLYMVKEMIEKDFSGTVSVKSYKTVGTCFKIVIPIKKEKKSKGK